MTGGLKDFPTGTFEMGYVLIEDIPALSDLAEDEKSVIIFVGSHDDLNIYQIWYNKENPGTQLRVIHSFVPIVRRLKECPSENENSQSS